MIAIVCDECGATMDVDVEIGPADHRGPHFCCEDCARAWREDG